MGKTLTITDDELGATASVRIEQSGGQPVIRSLHFDAADGHGISSATLSLMEDLGLRLPAQAPPTLPPARPKPAKKPAGRKAAPARRQAAASAPAPRKAAAALQLPEALRKAAPALPAAPAFVEPEPPTPTPTPTPTPAAAAAPRQRRAGPPPTAGELQSAFSAHGGNLTAMAEQFGCSVSTVSNWLRRARGSGTRITLAKANA